MVGRGEVFLLEIVKCFGVQDVFFDFMEIVNYCYVVLVDV